jgi:uncharacterized protein
MEIETGHPAAATAGPVSQTERIASLDILRGVAVLGILIMNIQSYSMIGAAYLNPTAYGDLTGANLLVWVLSYTFADQKFMTIFSMLFGAGILLMADRVESRGGSPARRHYARMFWLLVFGMMHAHLMWYGDILVSYAVCGLVVYLFRKLRPGWLVTLGLVSIAVSSAIWFFFGWSMQFWPPEALSDFGNDWRPSAEMIENELAAFRGGWLGQMPYRVPEALMFQTFVFAIWTGWRAGGLMLIGMAFHRLGVFSALRSRAVYLTMIGAGIVVGLPIVLYGGYRHFAAGWDERYSFFFGWQFNYWGSLFVSLGWVGLIMLACRAQTWRRLARPLAATGQMAFTNYIMQSVLCTTLFYGHGFGLYGRVERLGQIGIVVAIWILQLVVSPVWLKHFRFGPLEWLWRSLTYLRMQPFRRA